MIRSLWWVFVTLLRRSWLIIAGVLLGLAARTYLPAKPTTPGSNVINPAAKQHFDQAWAPFE